MTTDDYFLIGFLVFWLWYMFWYDREILRSKRRRS